MSNRTSNPRCAPGDHVYEWNQRLPGFTPCVFCGYEPKAVRVKGYDATSRFTGMSPLTGVCNPQQGLITGAAQTTAPVMHWCTKHGQIPYSPCPKCNADSASGDDIQPSTIEPPTGAADENGR